MSLSFAQPTVKDKSFDPEKLEEARKKQQQNMANLFGPPQEAETTEPIQTTDGEVAPVAEVAPVSTDVAPVAEVAPVSTDVAPVAQGGRRRRRKSCKKSKKHCRRSHKKHRRSHKRKSSRRR